MPQDQVCDLLYGAKAIALFLNMRERQARYLIEKKTIPSFKIDGTVCASRAVIGQWVSQLQSDAMIAALEAQSAKGATING